MNKIASLSLLGCLILPATAFADIKVDYEVKIEGQSGQDNLGDWQLNVGRPWNSGALTLDKSHLKVSETISWTLPHYDIGKGGLVSVEGRYQPWVAGGYQPFLNLTCATNPHGFSGVSLQNNFTYNVIITLVNTAPPAPPTCVAKLY